MQLKDYQTEALNKIIKKYKKEESDNIELEIRFGKYNEKSQFKPRIDFEIYSKIETFLKNNNAEHVYSKYNVKYTDSNNITKLIELKMFPTEMYTDINKITIPKESISSYSYYTKENEVKYDILEYGTRIALSYEIPKTEYDFSESNIKYTIQRYRKRYYHDNMYYDLSLYKDLYNRMYYDCEIEYCNLNKNKINIEKILTHVENVIKIIQNTENVMNFKEIENVLQEYRETINCKYNKFIGTQPHTIKINKIQKDTEYSLTYKLDGERKLLFVSKEGNVYAISKKMNIVKLKNEMYNLFAGTILDCEFYENKYYAFDILYYKGNKVDSSVDLNKKIFAINEILDMNQIPKNTIELKKYNFYQNLHEGLYEMIKNMDSEKCDGVILMPVNNPEAPVLKWKPEHLNTIDFKVNKIGNNTVELLCSGQNGDEIFHYNNKNMKIIARYTLSSEEYNMLIHNGVYEMNYNVNTEKFDVIKMRNDKTNGNFIKIAQDNFDSIVYPFNLELLKRSQEKFINMKRYHNWLKRKILGEYCSNKTLIDIGSGRGGDIQKWIDFNINYVEAYDIDSKSTDTAKERFEQCKKQPINKKTLEYNFEVKDLNNEELSNENKKIDNMTCFFALHYFLDNFDTFINNTVNKRLKKNGYFICCLTEKNSIDSYIKEDYSYNEFHVEVASENSIQIVMKDTIVKDQVKERVITKEELIEKMKKNNLQLVDTFNFSKKFKEWSKNRNYMEDYEMDMSFLNQMYVFKYV